MRRFLVLGASDAVTAYKCSTSLKADYIWASSFVMSSMLGIKDEGVVNLQNYIFLIESLIKGSRSPVILDFDIGGRTKSEYRNNVKKLKKLPLGGVCIEDEPWPKINAMLIGGKGHKLASVDSMSEKISVAKKILGPKVLVIARTHSFIADEDISMLQERIYRYEAAGADLICIHYADKDWKGYRQMLDSLKIRKPIFLILSKRNSMPVELLSSKKVQFVLYPNQVYRSMLRSIYSPELKKGTGFKKINLNEDDTIPVSELFETIEKINA